MKFIITSFDWGTIGTLLNEKNHIIDYTTDEPDSSSIGALYIGRIEQVKKNINSAFVRISEDQKVFLSLHESPNLYYTKKIGTGSNPVQGDEILVQLEKEAHKTKLAKATASFVLSGRYAVLTTDRQGIFVSSKITNDKLRKGYKRRFRSLANENYGFIIRTNAEGVSFEAVADEIASLTKQYASIMNGVQYKQAFSCLYRPMPAYLKKLRDLSSDETVKIVVSDRRLLTEIQLFIQAHGLTLNTSEADVVAAEELIRLYGLKERYKKLMLRKVWLKSGATIIIEPTEAMTVIDVNTEKTLSKKKSHETILKTNMEAAEVMMEQIRARNISGIIIADFIDMQDLSHRKAFIKYMEDLCTQMPIKTTMHGMTSLGLIEITRKKLARPIWENEVIQHLVVEKE